MSYSSSICAHGLCSHSLPYLDCAKRNVARIIHSENPEATDIDITVNASIASHLAWDIPDAPEQSAIPGVPVYRCLQYGVVLRGVVCTLLGHDALHAVYLGALTYITGRTSRIHLPYRLLLLRVPATSRSPSQDCPWVSPETGLCDCNDLTTDIASQVLRATRFVLAGAADSMTTTAQRFIPPVASFLNNVDPPAQFVNTFSEVPGTRLLVGADPSVGCPPRPASTRLPFGPQCKLPPVELVCCCPRPRLGAAGMLGDDVQPPLAYEPQELDEEEEDDEKDT
ncbi:hypothetical protein PENSPDRAFT_690452 [Peniophora sp. CONT]|nr:hypothetical protein PENSPDRAFT_690452 [Peniophora sp. CONT]